MNQDVILTKLINLKNNFQHLFAKKKLQAHKNEAVEAEVEDHYLDDLPLTINRDPGPGIKFYTTENSEFSRGLSREIPKGIDSFGED